MMSNTRLSRQSASWYFASVGAQDEVSFPVNAGVGEGFERMGDEVGF